MPAGAAVRWRVRVEMRPEGGQTFRGAGLPGGEEADAAGPVITPESFPYQVRVGNALGDHRRWSGGFCKALVAP